MKERNVHDLVGDNVYVVQQAHRRRAKSGPPLLIGRFFVVFVVGSGRFGAGRLRRLVLNNFNAVLHAAPLIHLELPDTHKYISSPRENLVPCTRNHQA